MIKKALLLVCFPFCLAAQEQVLVQESFEEGIATATDAKGDKKVAWFADIQASLNVVDDPGLSSGKAFQGHKIVGILPAVVLDDPGDTMIVSFDFRLVAPIKTDNQGFMCGIFEGGDAKNPWDFGDGEGYSWQMATGAASVPAVVVSNSGAEGAKLFDSQDQTLLGQSAQPYVLNSDAKHTVVLVIKKTLAGFDTSMTVDGTVCVLKAQDLMAPDMVTMNRFAIRSDNNVFLFDNFKVSIDMASNANGE